MYKPTRRGKSTALLATGAILATGGFAALGTSGAAASSHREAPLIAGEPQYDATDLYAFVSPDDKDSTTIVANWIPFEDPAGGPNFFSFATDARYDIKIDSNGDAVADRIFRYTFTNSYQSKDTFLYANGPVTSLTDDNLNFRQHFTLTRIANGNEKVIAKGPVAPSNVGEATIPDYGSLRDQAVTPTMNDKGQVYAGQADDPFFADLRVFDLLYGGNLSEVGDDTLAGYNVNTTVMQVPSANLTQGNDPVVGVWTTTQERTDSGSWKQVSRLGNPLVNEVVIPLKDKDNFNASRPVDDPQFLDYVTMPELPKLIDAVYGINAPAEPRNDLVSVFLTGVDGLNKPAHLTAPGEMLRLNTSIPPAGSSENRLGVIGGDNAGFPNGRRLGDDVIDIALQVVEGELVGSPNDLGDAVNQNDSNFSSTFPYVALPHSGSAVDSAAARVAPSGYTPLNGGTYDGTTTAGTSSLPIALLGAGALLLLVGGLGFARRPVTARVGNNAENAENTENTDKA
ncbi:MAG TPA: DUF4331 domain-containing protein [Actinomycetes bacterium]|nr:DUF4331 domain-containing protein [Actinomycetes bacterium]